MNAKNGTLKSCPCMCELSINFWIYSASVSLLPVHCNHHHCDNSRDMDRNLIMGLPIRDSTPPVMDNILHEVSSIRQYLEKRQACRDIAKEWLQVGYVLDVLLFRVYLLAMLTYTITLGTLWSVWQYAWESRETFPYAVSLIKSSCCMLTVNTFVENWHTLYTTSVPQQNC